MPVLSTDLLAYYRGMTGRALTVVDLETTGHKPPRSRAIEISVIQASLKDGILHQQTSLINPGVDVPPMITKFTGIAQEMVDTAPPAEEVWRQFLPLLSQGTITAHNITFDYPFIQGEYKRLGIPYDRPQSERLCTVILSRLMLSELPSRKLPDLVQHFQFPVEESHRAEADTIACWLLAERLLKEIHNEDDETVLARFGEQLLPLSEASKFLGCSQKVANSRLIEAGFEPFVSRRSGACLFRRRAIEQLYWESHQLSIPTS
ncbi:PolC-type DNA polymerase III [Myxacorys almedinensis]|uniref:3'-5' exonuclease n=1 Tax=Myxacorys almedinensis A TaxID=2690445 RepID=A0A8J7Z2F7_9CYAN|nr:3'-5' exonuclease [Myxacorys almedinensis]NDJ18794.1 3'-5' exonuclease [Myxacorys almedinensis A]